MENENINTENISLPENNEKEEVVESQVKALYNEPKLFFKDSKTYRGS